MPEQGIPLEIGKGRIVREGSTVALLSFGARLPECMKAAEMLAAQGLSTTVADARFAKPLDSDLILRLARNHELLITIEEGAIGGFGAHVLQLLAEKGALEQSGFKVRSMILPDYFIDQDSPAAMYARGRPRCEWHRRQGVRSVQRGARLQPQAAGAAVRPPRRSAPARHQRRRSDESDSCSAARVLRRGCARHRDRERAFEKYGPPVYVRHEIVHNKWVVDALKARGARVRRGFVRSPAGRRSPFSARMASRKRWSWKRRSAGCMCSTPPARWCQKCTRKAGITCVRAARSF